MFDDVNFSTETGPHRNTLLARFRFTFLHGFGHARCRSARHGHVHTVNTVVPESVRLSWKQFNMFKISGGRSSRCGFCGPIWLPQTLMTCHLSGWLVITALITGCVWLDQVRWDLWQVQLQLRMRCIHKNWSNNLIHQDVFVELNSPDLLFVTLAVVEGCVQRVGHILAVVQLANSATRLLKKNFSREYLLAVGVLPKRRLRNPHLFTHFLICGKVAF